MTDASLGIVIPAYNEADSLPALLKRLKTIVPNALLVVVDDSPNLHTVEAIKATVGLRKVIVFHREQKGGRGSAVLQGLRYLLEQGIDILVEMDADFSHDPQELPCLLKKLQEHQLDLLIGSRYLADSRIENWPLSRRLFSRFANALARLLLQVPVSDYTNGYRLYSQRAAQIVTTECGEHLKGFIILSEILVTLHRYNCKLGEAPTVFINRVRGESSVTWREITHAATGLLRLWLNRLLPPPLAPGL